MAVFGSTDHVPLSLYIAGRDIVPLAGVVLETLDALRELFEVALRQHP